ncbi:hypothetical protein UK23_16270 [Lentzea aerocolonigenes]|uniref:Histidine kinase n=2 Tax=Lentzea aerocolonigenes TaxID=68170 RepID=A0A0F0H369_LENAE|nr:hypothetical protein UK23_16270 [Lentzea aerocolonigenes]
MSDADFIPLSGNDLVEELKAMLDELCDVLHESRFAVEPVERIGEHLAALSVAPHGLRQTTEVLGQGLPVLPEFQPAGQYTGRIAQALGALGNGFATASRQIVLEQQEAVQRSLLKAVRSANWQLKEAESRFDEVVASSGSGILILGVDGEVVHANDATVDILGRTMGELVEFLGEVLTPLRDGTSDQMRQTRQVVRGDDDVATVSLTASVLRGENSEPTSYLVMIEDNTELVLLQRALARQQSHDSLTGLPNREQFRVSLESMLRQADPRRGITLIHLGLDSFDLMRSLGTRVADSLVVHVAARLRAVVERWNATVARFDGGEFGVLVRNSQEMPDIPALMEEINTELAEPVYVDGHGLAVSASAGVVHRPSHDMDADGLLLAAALTLHRARTGRRGQWEMFQPGSGVDELRDYALAAVMPGAWESGEISVRYRPVRHLERDVVTAVEAELCWDVAGLPQPLPHARCVELAEQTGLILPLGEWLLRTAGEEARSWRRFDLRLSVRLSAYQATDADLVGRIGRVMNATGVEGHRLMLGIPASALPIGDATDNLAALADMGVYTVLDDFGRGSLDLAAVQDLPVSCVRVASSRASHALALLPLVREAGVAVAVDGIDSAEEAGWWRSKGAEFGVGGFIGAASTPPELERQLELR